MSVGQVAYTQFFDAAFPGMLGDSGFDYTESDIAVGAVPFGLGLVRGASRANSVRLSSQNVGAITFSGALVTSNVVNLNVNGVAISPVTFGTDDITTRTALKTAILTALTAQGITAVGDQGTVGVYTVTVTGTDAPVVITGVVVTAGGGQATATVAQSEGQVFRGISQHMHLPSTAPVAATPAAAYQDQDVVNVLRRGRIWVIVSAAVAIDDTAYVNVADATKYGQLTNVSTGNVAAGGGRFVTAKATIGGVDLALLELNMP